MGGEARDDRAEPFRIFVAARGTFLLRTAYLLTGDYQLAEDLLQTALLKTYQAWPTLRHYEAATTYARRVLVTTNISWWRRRRHRVELLGASFVDWSMDDGTDERANREAMLQLLATLPKQQRAAVVLRYYEGLTELEVAGVLGCSVGTVKSQVHRALATLRVRLGGDIEHMGRRPAIARRERDVIEGGPW